MVLIWLLWYRWMHRHMVFIFNGKNIITFHNHELSLKIWAASKTDLTNTALFYHHHHQHHQSFKEFLIIYMFPIWTDITKSVLILGLFSSFFGIHTFTTIRFNRIEWIELGHHFLFARQQFYNTFCVLIGHFFPHDLSPMSTFNIFKLVVK